MKFQEMLDSYSDEELGAKMRDRYSRLCDAHAKGIADEHPSAQWNADNATLRAHRAANDNGLENATTRGVSGGPKEGERVAAQDSTSTLERATHDAARKAHERNIADAERARETEEFVPGYGRL